VDLVTCYSSLATKIVASHLDVLDQPDRNVYFGDLMRPLSRFFAFRLSVVLEKD
jgi:hypothetical protein